jgi:hypothetical protein
VAGAALVLVVLVALVAVFVGFEELILREEWKVNGLLSSYWLREGPQGVHLSKDVPIRSSSLDGKGNIAKLRYG